MNFNDYIDRCIYLASLGRGYVSPNPMVGCVVVCNDRIIGEGFHQKFGGPHAEVNAINSVVDKSLLPDSTLYVNLEPCSHFGKTPPCADLIIQHKIKRVVIAGTDPNPLVAGKGIDKLKQAEIEVITGIGEEENHELNKRFYTFHLLKRPYIILKWAATSDGFIDYNRSIEDERKPTWITNEFCKTLVHKWRTEEDAFMVGTRTVLLDNPQLTARLWYGKQPLRLSLDPDNILDNTLHLFDNSASTLLFGNKMRNDVDYKIINLNEKVPEQICNELYLRNIQSLVVEGGKELLESFIKDGFWDEARIFTGPGEFGEGVAAPEIIGKTMSLTKMGNSSLTILKPA